MTKSAASDVDSLSSIQAQHAMLLLYDLLPAQAWASGEKASLPSIEALGDELRSSAQGETAAWVTEVLDHGNDELKGEVSRHALSAMTSDTTLAPLVAEAVSRARHPHMIALPELIGACILVLSILPKMEITERDGRRASKFVFDPAGRAALLLEKIAIVMKAVRWRTTKRD